jgi:predicted permease
VPPFFAAPRAVMTAFVHHVELAAPLFVLVLAGYLLVAFGVLGRTVSDGVSRFVFAVALPALLFRLMSDLSRLPPVDVRVLFAFFGGCLIVFALARAAALVLFRLDGVSQTVFAVATVWSNNVLLGVPLARRALGEAALPTVALVLVFNAAIMWTLGTVSVEWARGGELSPRAFSRMARNVLTNPIVASILLGAAFGLTGWKLPALVDQPLALVSEAAGPLALLVLGMGLAEYGVGSGWREGIAITVLKLVVQPLGVWVLARLLGLPALQTQTVVLLASLAVGVNVYLMAREFDAMQGETAASLVLSNALAAVTTPLALALVGAGP